MGKEGMWGLGGHEEWQANQNFASQEELDACVSSMIKNGVKGGEIGVDPTKKEIQTRTQEALHGRAPETLTPAEVANAIDTALSNSGGGKTRFDRPKSVPREEEMS